MRTAATIIVLLTGAAVLILCSPTIGNEQQTPTNQENHAANKLPSGGVVSTTPQIDLTSQSPTPDKNSQTCNKTGWCPPPPFDMYWPTIGLVIAAGIAAWYARRTLSVIEAQSKDTGKAATAALKNAQAIVNAERAWIDIEMLPVNPPPDGLAKREYNLQVFNRGKTPGYIVDWVIGVGCQELDFPLHNFTEGMLTQIGSEGVRRFIPPNQPINELATFDLVAYFGTDWKDVIGAKKRGFVEISVHYSDIVASDDISVPTRITYAAYRCDSDANLHQLRWLTKFK
jgi:hypothetical protein